MRQRLIESHLPLVKAVARRYAGRGTELDDLVQVGAVGLIKASDRFDPAKGVAFAAFAAPTIEGEILHHLRDRGSVMRIPRDLQHLSRRIHHRQAELSVSLGRSPTVAEIAAALDTGEDEVERALAADRARDAVPLAPEDEAPAAEGPLSGSDDRLTLASTMRALGERERRIIYLRFHADKTERQIAQEMGISQAHVSRLLTGALSELRASLEMDGAQPSDTTAERPISPRSKPPAKKNRSGRRTKQPRVGDRVASENRERPVPVEESERLRRALEAWLAAEDEDASVPPGERDQPVPAADSDDQGSVADSERGAQAAEPTGSEGKATSSHSGRFLVRMPSTLHRQLAQAAEREQMSLNRFVTDALESSLSSTPPPPLGDDDDAGADAVPRTADATEDRKPPARTIRMVLAANLVVVVLAVAVASVLLVLALERGI
jgi:RNA polymerase sigma-B factor